VVIEVTYGWYWVVDLLQELGATVHLANPKALNWGERRVKNDVAGATDLADRLRLNRLPKAWIAPPAIRELRELVRYRAKLVKLRSGLKTQVHAVMAKQGVLPAADDAPVTQLVVGGRRWRRVFREAGDHRVGAMRTPMMRTCLQPLLDGLLSVERACSRFDRWRPESQSASGPRRASTGSSPRRSASM
jgi:transposase